jgi:hypothetical protein
MDIESYILSKKYANKISTGISDIKAISNGLEFTTNSGEVIDVNIPTATVNDNKEYQILLSDWVQDSVDTNKYTWTKLHNLNTKNIGCTIYDSSDNEVTVGVNTSNANSVILTNTEPMEGRIVINYSSILSSTSGSSSGVSTVNGLTGDVTIDTNMYDLIQNVTIPNATITSWKSIVVVDLNAIGADCTLTLPQATTTSKFKHVYIQNLYNDTDYKITIQPYSGDNLNGNSGVPITLKNNEFGVVFCSTGNNNTISVSNLNQMDYNSMEITTNTILDGMDYCVLADTTSSNLTVTLPTLTSSGGERLVIKNIGIHNVTVTAPTTIDGTV